MLGGVPHLCRLHLLEPAVVAVEDIEAVPHLIHPEI
jgi:hypothetical protein